MKIKPLSMGINKKNNTVLRTPKYYIDKIGSNTFDLYFDLNNANIQDIKVTLAPINCDHEVAIVVEFIDNINTNISAILVDVNSNTGLWHIECHDYNMKSYNLISDITEDIKGWNNIIAKHSFLLKRSDIGNDTEFALRMNKL